MERQLQKLGWIGADSSRFDYVNHDINLKFNLQLLALPLVHAGIHI